jgi:stearoyl-CoA desaturase (delta-9 desaturase)
MMDVDGSLARDPSEDPVACADEILREASLPGAPRRPIEGAKEVPRSQQVVTALLVFGPFVGLAIALPLLWGSFVNLTDIVMGMVLYLVPCVGLTVGYHRLFTHRSFTANRPLRIALAIAGSLGVEGSVTDWVATHRRHHRYSDMEGDPHSPHRYGESAESLLRGLVFAHVGWLFLTDATSVERYAPDMLADSDLRRIGRWFPALAIGSLALPFALGYALSGTLAGAFSAFVWAGLLRMALLHHVTWSVNSVCHTFGRRRFDTKDKSRDVAVLAVLSLGESWHNGHHAHPSWARHGAEKGQLDISAEVIRLFERLGWATRVRWPSAPGAARTPIEAPERESIS